MMSISQFSLSTGLNPKTLRFYDERGLLPPVAVDPVTGYRKYAASQLRDAATIRILRAAGMSLDQVAEALAEPDRLEGMIASHREHIAAERALQDRAIALADQVLPELEVPTRPRTRHAEAQHWVAAAYPVRLDAIGEDEQTPAESDALIGKLYTALLEAGHAPSGQFWTAMPVDGIGTTVEVLLTWPVAAPVPPTFAVEGLDIRRGTLPARIEAYLELLPADMQQDMLDDLPGGSVPHPALIVFSEYLESLGTEPSEMRQSAVGSGTQDFALVYSTTVSVN